MKEKTTSSKINKIGLIIPLCVFLVFLIIVCFSYFYKENSKLENGDSVLTLTIFGFLTIFISIIFAYISMCLNDKMLWYSTLLLYLLSIFWIILRVCKVILQTDLELLNRLIWYLYYLPMIFGPFILCSMANYIFIKNKKIFYIATTILLIISYLLFLLVLTNDFSQLVFVFDKTKPEDLWTNNNNYSRTIVYYLIYGFIIAQLLYTGVILGYLTRKKRLLLAGILYIICALIIIANGILYICHVNLPLYFRDMVLVYLFMGSIIIFIAVRFGIFISSGAYEDFFENSIFPLKVESKFGKTLENKSYINMNKNTDFVERTHEIDGNKFVVCEDITTINNYNKTLKKQLDEIIVNNAILSKEKEFKRKKEIDNSRKILNARIEEAIKSDINELNNLVNSLDYKLDKNDEVQTEILKKISILCIYIKRKSYLILMEENNDVFTKESLEVFTNEMLAEVSSNLKEYGVVINGIKTAPIHFVTKCMDFIYFLEDLLQSSYSLFLIYLKKYGVYSLKVSLIDCKVNTEIINAIKKRFAEVSISVEDNAYVFVIKGEKDV